MNRNWMLQPLFDTADGGGGVAVAPTPSAPTPSAPTPSLASQLGTPSKGMFGNGLRHNVKLEEKPAAVDIKAPETPAPTQVEAGSQYEVKGDDGNTLASFTTQAEAEAFIKAEAAKAATPTPTPTPVVDPEVLSRPLMGRYKTIREAEEGLVRSQNEGKRLYEENRTLKESLQKEIETRDSKMKDLQAELEDVRTHGVFKELSKEQIEVMKKENPSDYTEYLHEKGNRERRSEQAKFQRDEQTRLSKERQLKTQDRIRQRDFEMTKDVENYPGYVDQFPVMTQLFDMTGGKESPFLGHNDSYEIMYLASLGLAKLQADKAGKDAVVKAKSEAEAKARTDAATTVTPGGPTPSPKITPANPEDNHKKAMLAASKMRWVGPKAK